MKNRRSGSSLLEFTLTGIPVLFFALSIVECSVAMWEFHSLTNAVTIAARYAASHGAGCAQNGNTCTIQVKDVANLIATTAPILSASKLKVTLYTNSGTAATCNPLNTCQSSAVQIPSAADNAVGMDIRIVATYKLTNPMPMYWPPYSNIDDTGYTLGASSRQRIQF